MLVNRERKVRSVEKDELYIDDTTLGDANRIT